MSDEDLTIVEGKRRKPSKASKIASKRPKPKNVSKLTKELDGLFSRVIRGFAAKDGICTCYTCGNKAPMKKMHAGHYISRYYKATRWDENNVRPQCFICNIYRKGNSVIFRRNLVAEIGQEAVEEMEKSADILIRGGLPVEWFEEKITHYKQKLNELPEDFHRPLS